MLTAARKYTLAIYEHLTPAQLVVPRIAIVNPPAWELAHIAWFQEFWCCRAQPGRLPAPSRYPHFDAWYNSSVIPHAARWALPRVSHEAVLQQMSETEWEFAARAGARPANFPWGDDAALLRDCALDARNGRPVAVDSSDVRLGPLAHMLGNVWEWTATSFEPYPGFAVDLYIDYSAPWFGNHTVLRGGSFVTASCLIHNRSGISTGPSAATCLPGSGRARSVDAADCVAPLPGGGLMG